MDLGISVPWVFGSFTCTQWDGNDVLAWRVAGGACTLKLNIPTVVEIGYNSVQSLVVFLQRKEYDWKPSCFSPRNRVYDPTKDLQWIAIGNRNLLCFATKIWEPIRAMASLSRCMRVQVWRVFYAICLARSHSRWRSDVPVKRWLPLEGLAPPAETLRRRIFAPFELITFRGTKLMAHL